MVHTPDIRLRFREVTKVTDRPWCSQCTTDEYLLIERVERARFIHSDSLEISYTCMNCDGFYGHAVGLDTLSREVLNQFHVRRKTLHPRLDERQLSPTHSTKST